MTSHKIEHIKLKSLKEHILSNISTSSNTITVYHIIVGSKSYEHDFVTDSLLQSDRPRNHECPQIVENLLFNPDLQLSPDILSNVLKQNTDIVIRQVLILIDPVYSRQPNPTGLLSVIDGLPLGLSIEHNLEYINIKSILEPIIVPCDITESHIIELIKCLGMFRDIYPIVINIMDCSSITCSNLYANNIDSIDNWIHITKPKCLIDDTELQYIPMMAYCQDGINSGINPGITNNINSLFTYNKLNIRWINCKDDLSIIDSSITPAIYRNCIYSKNYYDFVVRLYKVETIEYSILLINKLWSVTTYTLDFTFSASGASGSSNEITFNFKTLSFEDFCKFWKYKGFRDLFPFSQGYDYIIFCKFINNFIAKYINKVGVSYLGLNPSIVDFLKFEAFEIFTNLVKYVPSDIKYLASSCETISRESINNYLIENGCNL